MKKICLLLVLMFACSIALMTRQDMINHRAQCERRILRDKEDNRVRARDEKLDDIKICEVKHRDAMRAFLQDVDHTFLQLDKQSFVKNVSAIEVGCVAHIIKELLLKKYIVQYDAEDKTLTTDITWNYNYRSSTIEFGTRPDYCPYQMSRPCFRTETIFYSERVLPHDNLDDFLFSFLQNSQDS